MTGPIPLCLDDQLVKMADDNEFSEETCITRYATHAGECERHESAGKKALDLKVGFCLMPLQPCP